MSVLLYATQEDASPNCHGYLGTGAYALPWSRMLTPRHTRLIVVHTSHVVNALRRAHSRSRRVHSRSCRACCWMADSTGSVGLVSRLHHAPDRRGAGTMTTMNWVGLVVLLAHSLSKVRLIH